ncbi:MAG: helix-turn-helix transcriptional regulator [Lachnospiraceae bacterium]|nr:helix-turn-helix transcriptional regulator [Lachnospiraceae bacterium]
MNILEYENYHEKKEHTQVDFPYNTYLCTIPLDFKIVPTHWHDEMELIYVKKGSGIITVDFEEYRLEAPALIIILPGQLHSIKQLEKDRMEYENIIFDPHMLISQKSDTTNEYFFKPLLAGKIAIPSVINLDNSNYGEIITPIDACDSINATKPAGYQLYIKSMLFQFFYILDSKCRDFEAKAGNRSNLEKMKTVLKYVENNYADKITIAEIAKLVNFSESHFMRYFKETIGTSFIDYLKDYRLTMAARLLKSSDSQILNIAIDVGFDNLSYFNRSFKAKYGVTPRQYRL